MAEFMGEYEFDSVEVAVFVGYVDQVGVDHDVGLPDLAFRGERVESAVAVPQIEAR